MAALSGFVIAAGRPDNTVGYLKSAMAAKILIHNIETMPI